MRADDLTDAERQILESLPAPPPTAEIRATNVWIVEWLPPNELQTGRLLHEWIIDRRPGWSAYYSCRDKAQVIQTIERATARAQHSNLVPVLHLEAHGGDAGIGLPDGSELLTWEELTTPLQQLNLATRCNLVVVVAACTGFAGIQALRRGPRAPAIALVGPDAPVMPRNLLCGATEFYRRWTDTNPNLQDIAVSASRAAGTVTFEVEPLRSTLLRSRGRMAHYVAPSCRTPAAHTADAPKRVRSDEHDADGVQRHRNGAPPGLPAASVADGRSRCLATPQHHASEVPPI